MLNVNQITSQLAKMPDPALQKYAAMHKNDPYILALAISESNRRKELRGAAQQAHGGQQAPKVVDQELAQMAQPMPEEVGIGALPAENMQGMAGGGIVAFAGGGTPFAEWLAQYGSSMQQYAQMPPAEQQRLRDLFRSPGPTMPVAPAQATTVTEALAPAAEAATEGRAYRLGRTLGSGLSKTGPAIAGTEVVSNLGSYKFKEPDLDTSVGGVYDALKRGDYSQAGRNLAMGLPEAGYDVARGIAGIGDYLLPGQPLAEGVDKAVKYFHGDNITTPSDTARAEEAAKKATDAQKAANAAATKAKEDFKVTTGTPTGNVMGSRRTPAQLAEEAAKNEAARRRPAAAPSVDTSGIKSLMAAADANKDTYIKEYDALYDALDKKNAKFLEEQKGKLKTDREEALYMSMIKGGLAAAAGTSKNALQNIAKGFGEGTEDFSASLKEFRKAAQELAKSEVEMERAQADRKAGRLDKYDSKMEKAADRQLEAWKTITSANATLGSAAIHKEAALEAAKLPGAQERMYAALSDPNSAAYKGFKNYVAEMGPEGKAGVVTKDGALKTWSSNLLLQQRFPSFDDYYRMVSSTSVGGSGVPSLRYNEKTGKIE